MNFNDEQKTDYNFKGYMALFSSQAFSLLGSSIVSFVIIWYLTIETGSALVLSIATIVGLVPMIVIAPFAGVLTDRLNRKLMLEF
jgi:DHA3 family macrolide efflux protein-like MFS transporter